MSPLTRSARYAVSRLKSYQTIFSNVAVPPLLVLLLVLSVTTVAFVLANNSLRSSVKEEAEQRSELIEQRLIGQLESNARLLIGGVGRLESAPIDRAGWQQYVAAFDFQETAPGIRALGVAEIIQPSQISAYESQKSAEFGTQVSVFPRRDDTSRYAVISYVEPNGDSFVRAIGYDAYTDSERASAMRSAAAENATALTGIVGLANSNNNNQPQPSGSSGLVMYRPYYDRSLPLDTDEQRLAAVRGYIFAGLRADTAFAQMLSPQLTERANIAIYVGDTSAGRTLYELTRANGLGDTIEISHALEAFGQTFYIDYAFAKSGLASASQINTPRIILAVGALTSLLLSFMTYFLLRTRYERLANEKDHEVQVAKDELLSLASHQLRTPATGVKQYLGMVLQGFAGDITDQQRTLLDKAYEGNDRQLRIINDILHLAKIDTGRVVLAKTTFDLTHMVRDVAEEQRGEAEQNHLELNIKTPKRARYHGDEHMLRMVIENLLSNAIKYTPEGGKVDLTLRTTATSYKIFVSDTGVGIDPSNYDRLFQQFTRIDNKRSHQVTGTGIGLYLAKHLVNLHKGIITVESTPDVGSTFTVTLPRRIL